jgi:PAS domain S-box-containing protein
MIEQPPRLPVPDFEPLAELVALLPQLIWIAAGDGSRLLFLNARWVEYTGQTADEALTSANDAIHPDDRAAAEAAWRGSLASGRPYESLMRIRRHDGAYRWFVAQCLPLHDASGTVARWFGSSTDVHDSVMAERDARFLAQLGDLPAQARTGEELVAAASAAIGAHFDAMCTVTVRAVDAHPSGPAAGGDRDLARTSTGEAVLGPGRVTVPLLRAGQPMAELVVQAGDLRHWEPREVVLLRLAGQRVWHALERLRLLGDLRRADREKDRFLATVGHELRNPLSPMRTALDVIHAQADRLPASVARPLGVLDRQVAQMSRIVDDLLDAARVASGQLTLQRETTDLRGLVHDAIDAARGALDGRRHTLHVEAGAVPAWAHVDPVRVRQVLVNLLTNAAKYTPPGGHVTVRLGLAPTEATLSIEDDGVGLAPEHLTRVFEMFYRVPAPDGVTAADGLGIGLALARRLVESQGGRIEASSPGPGGGATLRVTFPLAAAPHPVPSGSADVPRHGARVLVVDDNRDAADTLALLLGMFGCETAVAYTGGEALLRADDFQPEVILLDLQLPDISGHVVCAQLRVQAAGRPVRIVAVSGRGQAEDHTASAAAGFDAHLVKPVALAALHPLLAVR